MSLFIITLCITIPLFLAAALLFNFCRQRVGRTRHGLTGMCHESGGTMCGCCGTALQKTIEKVE